MSNKEFAGVYPYLVSPVNHDGSVKKEVLKDLVDHLIQKGVHGLTPLGSTGEFAYLTWDQKKTVVQTVIDSAAGRVPVVAGVCHTSNREAARQAQEFNSMGVDGILAIMDTYFPLSQKEVFSYFHAIADAATCPVVIYTNPKFQKTDLSIEVIKDLAQVPNIKYLKDASGNTGKLLTIANTVGDQIKLFSASASIPLFVLMLGGVGWMAGPACVVPAQSVELYNLAMERRWDEAIILQKRLWQINYVFQKYNLASCIKAALELQGFPVGDPVLPIQPVDKKALAHIARVLKNLEPA